MAFISDASTREFLCDVYDEVSLATDRLTSLMAVLNRHVEDVGGLKDYALEQYLAIDYAIQRVIGDIEREANRLVEGCKSQPSIEASSVNALDASSGGKLH